MDERPLRRLQLTARRREKVADVQVVQEMGVEVGPGREVVCRVVVDELFELADVPAVGHRIVRAHVFESIDRGEVRKEHRAVRDDPERFVLRRFGLNLGHFLEERRARIHPLVRDVRVPAMPDLPELAGDGG
jgi:hypothetical protein